MSSLIVGISYRSNGLLDYSGQGIQLDTLDERPFYKDGMITGTKRQNCTGYKY
jgi:hypothetical protein